MIHGTRHMWTSECVVCVVLCMALVDRLLFIFYAIPRQRKRAWHSASTALNTPSSCLPLGWSWITARLSWSIELECSDQRKTNPLNKQQSRGLWLASTPCKSLALMHGNDETRTDRVPWLFFGHFFSSHTHPCLVAMVRGRQDTKPQSNSHFNMPACQIR